MKGGDSLKSGGRTTHSCLKHLQDKQQKRKKGERAVL